MIRKWGTVVGNIFCHHHPVTKIGYCDYFAVQVSARTQRRLITMWQWEEFSSRKDVVNFPTAQPVLQRRKQRGRHLQLQHTTQLLIYADPLPLSDVVIILPWSQGSHNSQYPFILLYLAKESIRIIAICLTHAIGCGCELIPPPFLLHLIHWWWANHVAGYSGCVERGHI